MMFRSLLAVEKIFVVATPKPASEILMVSGLDGSKEGGGVFAVSTTVAVSAEVSAMGSDSDGSTEM